MLTPGVIVRPTDRQLSLSLFEPQRMVVWSDRDWVLTRTMEVETGLLNAYGSDVDSGWSKEFE
jgi:hypothetical protein